jgi:hypothetical protein
VDIARQTASDCQEGSWADYALLVAGCAPDRKITLFKGKGNTDVGFEVHIQSENQNGHKGNRETQQSKA